MVNRIAKAIHCRYADSETYYRPQSHADGFESFVLCAVQESECDLVTSPRKGLCQSSWGLWLHRRRLGRVRCAGIPGLPKAH